MKNNLLLIAAALFTISFCSCDEKEKEPEITRIAFGSCADQNKPHPILEKIVEKNPDLFIYLGDNIYGDSREMDTLRAKYAKLGSKPEFQKLRYAAKVLATWDDHDYGENDAGRHYPFKEASKEIFLDFWKEPKNSDRWNHEGIYHAEFFGEGDKRIQVILLDTRTFRDDLKFVQDSVRFKNDYEPNLNPDSTMLGSEQWAWLEQQFKQPAALRIMASSNQFSHEYNGWESWTNIPHEQKRMLDLIKKTKANGVVFISGDVHWGELSKMEVEGQYPIYDVTSSGITQEWDSVEPNKNRIGEVVRENNVGLIEVHWGEQPKLKCKIFDIEMTERVSHSIMLKTLAF